MDRSESQFCRDEAERLLKLAKETTDANVRQHLIDMASEWVARAKLKQMTPAKSDQGIQASVHSAGLNKTVPLD